MNIKLLQEKYPKIIGIIPAVEVAKAPEKCIGYFTSKIEQKKDIEALKQWIEYLSSKNATQALLAISKLKRVNEEEKEHLKSILLKIISQEPESIEKQEKLMLILLHLKEFEKANILYQYLKFILNIDISNIQNGKTKSKRNEYIINCLKYLKKYRQIFIDNSKNNEQQDKEEGSLETILFADENEKFEKSNEILNNLNIKIEEQRKLLESLNIEIPRLKLHKYHKGYLAGLINRLKKFKENLEKEDYITFFGLIKQIREARAELIKIFNKENEVLEKFIQDKVEITKINNDKAELLNEFKETNRAIIEILNDSFNKEIMGEYRKLIAEIYNIFFSYRNIRTKTLKNYLGNINSYLKIADKIIEQEECEKINALKQLIIETIEQLEKSRNILEIEYTNQLLVEKLIEKQNDFITILENENKNIKEIMKRGIIDNKDYKKIREYAKIIGLEDELQEKEEEIIEIDPNLDKIIERIREDVIKKYKFNIKLASMNNSQISIPSKIEKCLLTHKLRIQNKDEFKTLVKNIVEVSDKIIKNRLQLTNFKDIYIMSELEKLKIFNNKKMSMINFNNIISSELLKESNYELILKYISIIQANDDYLPFRIYIHRFRLVPKQQNKQIIIKIVNNFIEENQTYLALEFLKNIEVTKYTEYLPKEKNISDYINELSTYEQKKFSLPIQKELFFEENNDIYNDYMNCSKAWLQYLEKTYNIEQINEISVQELSTIIKMITKDITILDNDKYVKEKIKSLSEIIENNYENIEIANTTNIEFTLELIVKILESETDIKEKIYRLKQIEGINIFKYYNDNRIIIFWSMIKSNFNTIKTKIEIIFRNMLDNEDREELENIIYIYMNSVLRYHIPIEKFVNILIKNNYKNIFEYLNKYNFFGKIIPVKNGTTYRMNLINITNENRTRLERDDFEYIQNPTKRIIYKTEIEDYNEIYDELAFKNTKIYYNKEKNTINKLNTYIDMYKYDIDENFNNVRQYLEHWNKDNLLIIINFQVHLLENLDNRILDKMRKDNINPYKYYDSYSNEIVEQKKLLSKINKGRIIATTEGKKYYEKIKDIYVNLVQNNMLKIEDIVYYYMNSATKYILNINEFINILVENETESNKIQEILRNIGSYKIIFEKIDEENNIENVLQIISEGIKYTGNPIKKEFANNLTYLKGSLKYNIENKRIYIDKLQYTNLPRNSRSYKKLINILDEFTKTQDMKVLENLRNMDIILELSTDDNRKYAGEKFLLWDYRILYNMSVAILINNLENLKTFILLLRKNNYWKKLDHDINYLNWNAKLTEENKRIVQIFLERAKKEDPATVIYCYKNTYLKTLIPLDELLKAIYRFNRKGRGILTERGNINLKEYELKLLANIEKIDQDHTITINVGRYADEFSSLKVRIKGISDIEQISKQVYLKVEKYSTISNIIYCSISDKYIRTVESRYNNKQLAIYSKILKENHKIEDIYEFITDDDIKSNNKYYNTWVEQEYVDDLLSDKRESLIERKKQIYQEFENFIIAKIKNNEIYIGNNINYLLEFYDKTPLRYIMKLIKFIMLISTTKRNLEFGATIQINKNMLYCCNVYFPRYKSICNNAKLIYDDTENVEEGKYYEVLIQKYDTEEKSMVLNLINTDLLQIIENQINILYEFNIKAIKEIIEDTNNPYKYVKYEEFTQENFSEKIKKIIQYKKIVNKQKYYEKVKQKYINLFKEGIQKKLLIDFYMNTATRYILNLNEFIEMIALAEQENYKYKNIRKLFANYEIMFGKIDIEQNNITDGLQTEFEKIKYIGSPLKPHLTNDLLSFYGTIASYNKDEKQINIEKIYYTDIIK